jgi:peptidoglycan/xylan/chitin deacetylase (PgdA/CDA1 family)
VAGILGIGALVAGLVGGRGFIVLISLVLGLVYLRGTFSANTRLFGRVLRTHTNAPQLALTFDDGPDPRFTPAISSLLAGRGHRATFFVLGTHVRAHPGVLARLANDGHEVASHGDSHGLLAFSPPSAVHQQLEAVERAVDDAVGMPPARLFRAPHGVRSPWLVGAARRRGYEVCGWDGRVFDTAAPGVEQIVARVRPLLRPGAVILLHDGDGSGRGGSREQTLAALRPILDELDRRGLRSVPLSELARIHERRHLAASEGRGYSSAGLTAVPRSRSPAARSRGPLSRRASMSDSRQASGAANGAKARNG